MSRNILGHARKKSYVIWQLQLQNCITLGIKKPPEGGYKVGDYSRIRWGGD